MIKLIVDGYCENCPEFCADVEKTHVYADESQITNTVIMCEHRNRCKYIKDMLQKIEGDIKMIKLEGRVLLFDVINQLSNKISKDCKLTMSEKVPLTWNFEHDKPIGFATPIRDAKGIYATAETFSNEYIGIEDIRDILTDGKIGVGGYYSINKRHNEGELDIIDEATLLEIGLTLAPVREEYYFKIVEEKK